MHFNIIDVDNDLSELTFYGQLPNETVNAEMDITNEQQSLIFNLNNIQTAGLHLQCLFVQMMELILLVKEI